MDEWPDVFPGPQRVGRQRPAVPPGLALGNHLQRTATQHSSCRRRLQSSKYSVFPRLGVGGSIGRCELLSSIMPPTALPLRVTQLTGCPPLIGNFPANLTDVCILCPLLWVTGICISGQKSWFRKCEKHGLRQPVLLLVLVVASAANHRAIWDVPSSIRKRRFPQTVVTSAELLFLYPARRRNDAG